MELMQLKDETWEQLNDALRTYRENGLKAADADREYQMAKSKVMFELKASGSPVTFIEGVIRGIDNIAELRYKRACADVIYKANEQAIYVKTLQLKIIESSINREWNNG